MTRKQFQDVCEVDDQHTQSIVELVRSGRRHEAMTAFLQLCASIVGLDSRDAMLLSQRIHERARVEAA